jgi:hypothetical protein
MFNKLFERWRFSGRQAFSECGLASPTRLTPRAGKPTVSQSQQNAVGFSAMYAAWSLVAHAVRSRSNGVAQGTLSSRLEAEIDRRITPAAIGSVAAAARIRSHGSLCEGSSYLTQLGMRVAGPFFCDATHHLLRRAQKPLHPVSRQPSLFGTNS